MITDDGQAELLALAIVYGLIAAEIGDIWKYERKVGVGEQRLLLLFPGSGMAEMRHAVWKWNGEQPILTSKNFDDLVECQCTARGTSKDGVVKEQGYWMVVVMVMVTQQLFMLLAGAFYLRQPTSTDRRILEISSDKNYWQSVFCQYWDHSCTSEWTPVRPSCANPSTMWKWADESEKFVWKKCMTVCLSHG